jgi:hypothetical protein
VTGARLAPVLALALFAAGCAMAPLPPAQATLDNIQAVRASHVAPMGVGAFTAAPGRPTEMDKSIAVRLGVVDAPGGSFAHYLGDTLAAQLKGAGRYDPVSTLTVSGVVTETHLESQPKPGAAIAARFTLTRAGKVVFEKTLRADADWDWNYFADVAIPDAMNHYAGLFPALVGKLLADPDFQAAAQAG